MMNQRSMSIEITILCYTLPDYYWNPTTDNTHLRCTFTKFLVKTNNNNNNENENVFNPSIRVLLGCGTEP